MIREVDLISYLPEYLQAYREMRETLLAQQQEIQRLEDLTETIQDNQFILYSNEEGIERFENLLKTKALDDDSLENRKFRVLSLWNNSIPYTVLVLHNKLETICGKDGYNLKVINEQYKVIVRVALKSKKNFEMVEEMLNTVLPANMVIDLSLLYNQHLTLSKFTHEQLKARTHREIREEVLGNGS